MSPKMQSKPVKSTKAPSILADRLLACRIAVTVLLIAVALILIFGLCGGKDSPTEQPVVEGGFESAEEAAMAFVKGTYLVDYDLVRRAVFPALQETAVSGVDSVAALLAEHHYEFSSFAFGDASTGDVDDYAALEAELSEAYGQSIRIAAVSCVDVDFAFSMDGEADANFVTATVAKISGSWFVVDWE